MKTNRRNIELVHTPPAPHWVGDGFYVHNFIPGTSNMLNRRRMDPFIMLDYNALQELQPNNDSPRGVGVHPHRGFETVTITYHGMLEHTDSHGGGGIIGEGDVQWMTAASGVLHKEFHEKEWAKRGGLYQMVQLWTNLPAQHKMSAPKYQAIKRENFTKVETDGGKVRIEIISGEYNGNKGVADTFSPINLMNAYIKNGGKAKFNFPSHYNTGLLVLKGEVVVNDSEQISTDNFVLMANDGEEFVVEAITEDTLILVMSGEPLNEPIAAYGPFVMNYEAEIRQAMLDYSNGKFGKLED